LNVNADRFPLELRVTFIGYQDKTIKIKGPTQDLQIALEENSEVLEAVDVIEQRLSEKQRESALTVEALDNLAIKETPAANFYEALGNLKGVDLTSASIGFKIINTRGFNSTSPVRSLQLIDGVDNQAPGLNFSLGNFLGANELDILNVDIIAGASTAFYGPGAFNGVIAMTTKNPFDFQGLSFSQKVGERALSETSLRYAEAFKLFNSERENFAFKLNLFYLRANDWEADNYDPVDGSPVGADNPGRFDAVNIYGDESLVGNNDRSGFDDVKNSGLPGLGIFYRPGYQEPDLVDYDTENFKGNLGLFYRTEKDIQFSYTVNYGAGTTVYQGENRFSLNNIQFMQNIFEVKKQDRFFVRAYATVEDAGDSYDAVLTAFKMNEAALDDEQTWNQNYSSTWRRRPFNFAGAFQDSAGFNVNSPSFDSVFFANDYQDILTEYNDLLGNFHDSLLNIVSGNRPLPGSAEYDSLFNDITSRTFTEGGSRFFDRSALYHIMGEYQFDLGSAIKMRAGGNYRLYRPNSRGNIFDEIVPGSQVIDSTTLEVISQEYRRISNEEFGAYLGGGWDISPEILKLSATLRLDKNQNFDFLISPAMSVVWNVDANNTLRASLGRAIRNPTLQDQFLNYDVGRAILKGNLNGYDSLITIESFGDYREDLDLERLSYFNVAPIAPEEVTTAEIGYRASLFKRFFVDLNYFHSWYTNFIGFQFGVDVTFDPSNPNFVRNIQALRVAANAEGLVTTQGFNAGLNYYLDDHLTLTGNYSFNQINLTPGNNLINRTFYGDLVERSREVDPIVPAFNTPEHKFNLGINGRNYQPFKSQNHKLGFAITFKWVEGFIFEGSPQFTGFIDSYYLIDAQVSYIIPDWHSTFKLGASNITNNLVFQVYGGPRVGRLAYFSWTFEWF
jgi:outer membrane receptor protein involved in Fe transport